MTAEVEYRPGLADVPVAESAVSFLDGKRARLEYRGIAVETLARESCFEETAWLLLKGELPTQKQLADFDHELRHHRAHQVQADGPASSACRRPGTRWTPCRPASPRWACSTRARDVTDPAKQLGLGRAG